MNIQKTFLILSLCFISQSMQCFSIPFWSKKKDQAPQNSGKRNLQKAVAESLEEPKERRKDVINPPESLEILFDWLADRNSILQQKKQLDKKEQSALPKEETENLPDGILVAGSPGTGKTFDIRALAGEAGYLFYYVSAGDLGGSFVNERVEHLKALIIAARGKATKEKPAFVFIDEAHALAGKQNASNSNSDSENQKALTQLLIEMSNKEKNKYIIFAAATSKPKKLNKAFIRAGRLSHRVDTTLPNEDGIKKSIVKATTNCDRCTKNTPPAWFAKKMFEENFTHSAIENTIKKAAILARLDESWNEFSIGKHHYQKAFNQTKNTLQKNKLNDSEEELNKREQAERIINNYLNRNQSSSPKEAFEVLKKIGFEDPLLEKDIEKTDAAWQCDYLEKKLFQYLAAYDRIYENSSTITVSHTKGSTLLFMNKNNQNSIQEHQQLTEEGRKIIQEQWNEIKRCRKNLKK